MGHALPFVSIVIPVRNDTARLGLCLEALHRQDFPVERYEILVVDNGSHESPAAVVSRFPRARFLNEPLPAADRARNTGIRAARGEVFGFTDSDCVPRSDWIRLGVDRLGQYSPPGLVAGRIDVTAHDPKKPTLAELHDLVLAFPQQRCVRRSHYGATANLFTHREVFEAVGLFREDYGGDAEWGQRVHRSGRQVVYADEVRVSHPAKETVAELMARTRRGAGVLVNWRRAQPLVLVRDQLKDLVPPPDFVWKILSTPVLPSASSRVRIFMLFIGLRQVRFWERLRVLGGGDPVR